METRVNVTPERWQQVARIYELAADHDPATRDTFLSEVCGGDEWLVREVQSLLCQDEAPVVVDRSVWATAARLFPIDSGLGPGATLGPYRIDGLLGAGGMGAVFSATDTRLNRRVALKVILGGIVIDQHVRARFAREAEAVAALTHPHICTLYDVGRHDGIDFLVMEHLEGDTLAARLANGPLPFESALAYAKQIGSALDHAHRHGIIHRDLKPANILLTAGGAKLLDFGLAKFRTAGAHVSGADDPSATVVASASAHTGRDVSATEHAHLTCGGAILGTVRYMAPEQITGHEVDARSDVFSFGAVLYEMFAGRRAFDGDTPASIRDAILEREPLPVSSHQPLVPPVIDEIVRRCLAKNPDERWQTAGDVLREFEQVFEPKPLTGTHRRRAWAWAAAFVLAAVGFGVWLSTGPFRPDSTVQSASEIRSIAVLPLEDLSGDPEQEYFADGMTEHLIGELAKIRGLRVISRMSVMHYKKAPQPVPLIAKQLHVNAIIEGSVARANDRVRILVKLVRGATGEVLWTQSFERETRDVLALQGEIARAITTRVDVTLTPQEQARLVNAFPVDPELVEESRKHGYFCPYEIATAYVSLGDKDTAHRWFRKGVEERADCMAWLGVEPWIESFRSDPRYSTLLREIGLDPSVR
jgi:serine/threonine protein kinase